MFKRGILIVSMFLACVNAVSAETITITPMNKITTSIATLQEGDVIEFKNVKTGEIITGELYDYQENGFLGQNAIILIDNFKVKSTNENLKGFIYANGRIHNQITEFPLFSDYAPVIRGGEVKILPGEEFTLETLKSGEKVKRVKTSVKLAPAQIISTDYNEIDVGSKIRFKILNDVYKDGTLYIKKDSSVVARVSHVKNNGWSFDHTELTLDEFYTRDAKGNVIKLDGAELELNAFEMLKWQNPKIRRFWNYASCWWRGKEFNVTPESGDNPTFNIWIK